MIFTNYAGKLVADALSFTDYFTSKLEQPWPSGNALDSDQRGPGFEAHRRPLVTSGKASG